MKTLLIITTLLLVTANARAAVQAGLTWDDPSPPAAMVGGYRIYTAPLQSTNWTLHSFVRTNAVTLTLTNSAQVAVAPVSVVFDTLLLEGGKSTNLVLTIPSQPMLPSNNLRPTFIIWLP